MQSFDDIAADLSFLDDWDARFEYLIDLGRALPAFPADKRTEAHRVKGCASQVWLDWRRDGDRLVLAGDSDAHIVKGLVALTLALFSGRTRDEIAAIDAAANRLGRWHPDRPVPAASWRAVHRADST